MPGEVALPSLYLSTDEPICILRVWFGPGLNLERNWSEVLNKVKAQMGTWFQMWLTLKCKAKVFAVYIFPLIL